MTDTQSPLAVRRFEHRRIGWAFATGEPLPPERDPARTSRRAMAASFLIAAVIAAGAGVIGLLSPVPDWVAAPIVLDTDTGTLYVNRDGTLSPVLNLASAVLVGGAPPTAIIDVRSSDLGDAPRGPLIGIAGAPWQLPAVVSGGGWTVCQDGAAGSVVLVIGDGPEPDRGSDAGSVAEPGALVSAPDGSVQLLWDGRRAVVDMAEPSVVAGLGLAGVVPRAVSGALLEVVPRGPDLGAIAVPHSGELPTGFAITTATGQVLPIGAVFRVLGADGESTHLVVPDGVRTVTGPVAEILRNRSAAVTMPTVAPAVLTAAPTAPTSDADLAAFPAVVPDLAADGDVLCTGVDGRLMIMPTWPTTFRTVTVGPGVAVTMGNGAGAVVRPAGRPPGGDQRVRLVIDSGTAYPIADEQSLAALGYRDVVDVPAAIVDLLPLGPTLSLAAADDPWTPMMTASTSVSTSIGRPGGI